MRAVKITWILWGLLVACSDSDPAGTTSDDCRRATPGVISNDHGHSLRPMCSQDLGADQTLRLKGDHEHTLFVSEEQVDLIMNGNMVILQSSSTNLHIHSVTYN